MLAETVQQANHCFSLPTRPAIKTAKSATKNAPVIKIHEMDDAVICPDTGKSLKHQEVITLLRCTIICMRSTANDIHRVYRTTTIRFIRMYGVPAGRKVKYGSFVVDIKEHMEEKEHIRLTVGGDQIEYPGEKSTCVA
jgi:hypothetical protein